MRKWLIKLISAICAWSTVGFVLIEIHDARYVNHFGAFLLMFVIMSSLGMGAIIYLIDEYEKIR